MWPCCGLQRCDAAGDQASPEQAERSLFLAGLVAHMDSLRARMGGDWAPFADELHHRILPAVHVADDVSIDVTSLQRMADGVREQCMAWPGGPVRAWFEAAAPRVAAAAAAVALPRGWREKQDLLNHFQQLERRLRRGEDLQRELEIAKASGNLMKTHPVSCSSQLAGRQGYRDTRALVFQAYCCWPQTKPNQIKPTRSPVHDRMHFIPLAS